MVAALKKIYGGAVGFCKGIAAAMGLRVILLSLIDLINGLSGLVGALFFHKTVYKWLGLVATRKFRPAQKQHKYAILVAARNEEAVIGQLIDSIRRQDYPADLVDIYVVADNCDPDDRTAQISRSLGVVCYERHDLEHRTKGFALQFLVERIREDVGIEAYEGYFIFDADNLLKQDFITKMNDAFDAGEKIVTSYRNTKNFDDNWISASYGIHWLRTVRMEHRPRSFLHLATRIQGTGFLFSHELIQDGWNYTSLTEDRAFCADAVANGYKISYQNEAEFYDEQPTEFRAAWVQRVRWAKGHLQAFTETAPKLGKHIFVTGGAANVQEASPSKGKRLFNNLRLRFMSFDMLTVVYPRAIFRLAKKILEYALYVVIICTVGMEVTTAFCPSDLRRILAFFALDPVFTAPLAACLMLAVFKLAAEVSSYLTNIFYAAYIYFVECRRIMKIKWYRKVWFCLTYPLFNLIGRCAMYVALFSKVEWKPTAHNTGISIEELAQKL